MIFHFPNNILKIPDADVTRALQIWNSEIGALLPVYTPRHENTDLLMVSAWQDWMTNDWDMSNSNRQNLIRPPPPSDYS